VPYWLTLLLALVPVTPTSSSSTVAGIWTFDEPKGERTAVDRGPDGLDARVGKDITTGVVHEGATVYRFPEIPPNSPPAHPEHLVAVPDTASLDPGEGAYAVTIRFRTESSPSNIVQKGQRASGGGYWKIDQDDGRLRCLFLDATGHGVSAYSTSRIADGAWHTATCARTADTVTLDLDGEREATTPGTTGAIANGWPLTIGGKPECDQVWVGCDYFSGDVDFVRVVTG
jgi:hypothetical protein